MTTAFHDIRFPLRLSLATSGGPVRRTDIVNLSNGRENRNSRWRDARRSYDAGSGIRSVADLYAVLEFFEARSGQLYGFRFRDPVDWASAAPGAAVTPVDQPIGTGDGATARFALRKTYADLAGQSQRAIAKPVAGTVVVAVNGITVPAGQMGLRPGDRRRHLRGRRHSAGRHAGDRRLRLRRPGALCHRSHRRQPVGL
ncbi:MAG: DUF2460 domain-containing protein [Pantoea sp.]|nr:DUF2460 domain-containing protein [Pantoea sp.]MDE1186264.1 DUF2460 domain-containing protein [Pantoea sp.]